MKYSPRYLSSAAASRRYNAMTDLDAGGGRKLPSKAWRAIAKRLRAVADTLSVSDTTGLWLLYLDEASRAHDRADHRARFERAEFSSGRIRLPAPTLELPAVTMSDLVSRRPEEWREHDNQLSRSGSPDVATAPQPSRSDPAR